MESKQNRNGRCYLHYHSEERDKGFMLPSNDVGIRGTKLVMGVVSTTFISE